MLFCIYHSRFGTMQMTEKNPNQLTVVGAFERNYEAKNYLQALRPLFEQHKPWSKRRERWRRTSGNLTAVSALVRPDFEKGAPKPSRMVLLFEGGLKNDSVPLNTAPTRASCCRTSSPRLCRCCREEPSFNFCIWYVELLGIDYNDL
uniref:(northern house mosquito) hypothetical protein n=1 Tax=Culex pipiens TaxID=7175 RepID=A0A8D8GEV8_CULPI